MFETTEPYERAVIVDFDTGQERLDIAGRTRFRSLEVTGSRTWGNFTLGAGGTFVDTNLQDTGTPDDGSRAYGVARWSGYINAEVKNTLVPRLDLSVDVRGQSKSLAQSPGFTTLGFVTADLQASYRLDDNKQSWTLRAALVNAFNTYYWLNSGFEYAPGPVRTVRVELSKRF